MATEMEAEVDEIEIEIHAQQVSGKEMATSRSPASSAS
jgi:hypothetical protein